MTIEREQVSIYTYILGAKHTNSIFHLHFTPLSVAQTIDCQMYHTQIRHSRLYFICIKLKLMHYIDTHAWWTYQLNYSINHQTRPGSDHQQHPPNVHDEDEAAHPGYF